MFVGLVMSTTAALNILETASPCSRKGRKVFGREIVSSINIALNVICELISSRCCIAVNSVVSFFFSYVSV